jgi:hypothetical protein
MTISMDPSIIDKFISAEILDKELDPVAYAVVENYMIHMPCEEANKNSVCMEDNKCTKHFPKAFNPETMIDEEGFPVYKRRNDDIYVKNGKIELDNMYVVPYNRGSLVKYQAHINIEWCNMSRLVKYLFKYIHKGLEMRYISTIEACWRLFQFDIHYQDPAVERLNFHLENEQQVVFPDSTDIEKIVAREGIKDTKFTKCMEINKTDADARELAYLDFPTKYVWKASDKV